MRQKNASRSRKFQLHLPHPHEAYEHVADIRVQILTCPINAKTAQACNFRCGCYGLATWGVRIVMSDKVVFDAFRCDNCLKEWVRKQLVLGNTKRVGSGYVEIEGLLAGGPMS